MEWREIKGYEGIYFISNTGLVKSKHRQGRILAKRYCKGYLLAALCKKGITISYRVHRLVAEYFVDNPENKADVNHLDGCKDNNHHTNLEWCSASENMKHAYYLGLKLPVKPRKHNGPTTSNKD